MKIYIEWGRLSSYLARQIDKAEKENNQSQIKFWHKVYGIMQDFADIEKEPTTDGDYISREKTLEKFCDYVGAGMSMNDFDALYDIVLKMPSVQQKQGHWIDDDGDNAICSCCNRLNHLHGIYCKHCGAKMEG